MGKEQGYVERCGNKGQVRGQFVNPESAAHLSGREEKGDGGNRGGQIEAGACAKEKKTGAEEQG